MASYSIIINMSPDTLEILKNSGSRLYGLKAIKTALNGSPVIWFANYSFLTQTSLKWSSSYQVYTSSSEISENNRIITNNVYSVGNTLNVTDTTGSGHVYTDSETSIIEFNNTTANPFTCGVLQQQPDNSQTMTCALTLPGNTKTAVSPIEQVMLMFSQKSLETDTVIDTAFSDAIFIDLTDINSRTVNYDVNNGWSWDGGNWAQSIASGTDIVPLLIQQVELIGVNIRNESDITICTGYTTNLETPVEVIQLSEPSTIIEGNTYQIGAVGGSLTTMSCVLQTSDRAMFS